MTIKRICITFLAAFILSASVHAKSVKVSSPDGNLVIELDNSAAKLAYTLSYKGKSIVEPSHLSLFGDEAYELVSSELSEEDSVWEPVWGSFSEIRDHCNQLILKLKLSGLDVNLICRVYNDGVGFRFAAPAHKEWTKRRMTFSMQSKMAGDYNVYYTIGEKAPLGPISLKKMNEGLSVKMPVVMESDDKTWLAVLESDLYTAKQFDRVAAVQIDASNTTLNLTGGGVANGEAFVSPWRVILVGDEPGDLVNSTIALSLAAPCAIEDTSWIETGKSFWDWRVHGYDNGDFKYGINTQSYLRFIDRSAELGVKYFAIDDYWYKGGKGGQLITSPEIDMEKVMAYAEEKGVKIILYFDRRGSKGPLLADPELFEYYKSLGAYGIKYGFQGPKVGFTRSSIEGTAEHEMFIFYHDNPAALIGVERTMPNFLTREFCHAQQDGRRAYTPTGFLKMAMINTLSGPLDMANGNFGINSINAGEREKGPRKRNTYISTVVSEVARCLVISTPLVKLPDAPEEYLKKPDLYAYLKAMPATWDDSRVVNSKMAEYITTARRTGDTWFVGSVNNETPRDLEIVLDFLEPGVSYELELFEDTADAHGLENPEVYKISKQTVEAGTVITASMAHGGGHAMIIRPLKP